MVISHENLKFQLHVPTSTPDTNTIRKIPEKHAIRKNPKPLKSPINKENPLENSKEPLVFPAKTGANLMRPDSWNNREHVAAIFRGHTKHTHNVSKIRFEKAGFSRRRAILGAYRFGSLIARTCASQQVGRETPFCVCGLCCES